MEQCHRKPGVGRSSAATSLEPESNALRRHSRAKGSIALNVTTASEPELLTTREVSERLRLPLPTVYYLAQKGDLPGFQVGKRWRFRREDIDRLRKGNVSDNGSADPRVLVLDDDAGLREMLVDLLPGYGCHVTAVAEIEEAVAAAQRTEFDVLLVDLVLRHRRGTEFIEAVRDQYSLRQFVIITGHADLLETAPLLELGAITVLKKPFPMSQLMECLEQLCGKPLPAVD